MDETTPEVRVRRHPTLALFTWPLGALLVAVVMGGTVGVVAGMIAQPAFGSFGDEGDVLGPDMGWLVAMMPLGAVVGVTLGAIVLNVTWVGGLVWAARRLFPGGRWGVPVILTVVVGWVAVAIAARIAGPLPAVGDLIFRTSAEPVPGDAFAPALATIVVALAVGGLVFPAWARWAPPPPPTPPEEPADQEADDVAWADWLPDKGA